MEKLSKKTALAAVATAAVYLILFLFFDKSISLWVHHNLSDTLVATAGKIISYLAFGAYVKLVLSFGFVYIFITDPGITKTSTKNFLYICITVTVAIIIGEGFKYLLGRYRPVMLFEKNLYGLHFFSVEWAMNSSPSGHTLRAFSFFTALSLLFRRYTVLFIFVALMIGISRVVVTAHYTSDVLFGAFVGTVTALWMYRYFYKSKSG